MCLEKKKHNLLDYIYQDVDKGCLARMGSTMEWYNLRVIEFAINDIKLETTLKRFTHTWVFIYLINNINNACMLAIIKK